MDTRTTTCRACGRRVTTNAPPVVDEIVVCARCAALPAVQSDATRPVTVCRVPRAA